MGYPPSVPLCPRCGTPFPITEPRCRNCGLTQEVAQDPFWRSGANPAAGNQQQANAYQGQQPYGAGARPPAPAIDPFEHARRAQTYEPPAYNYAASAKPPRRSFWRSLAGFSLIAFLLLMVVGVSAFAIYYYPMLCSAQQRNNLRSDIPLPCGITFEDHLNRSASGTTGPGSEEWVYTVDSQTPAQIKTFYQGKLPNNGWSIPPAAQNNPGFPDALLACKASDLAIITGSTQTNPDDNVTPPQGSSLLIIILLPVKNAPADLRQALGPRCG